MVDLIPGTALPLYAPGDSDQPEGRGTVEIRRERMPVSMIDESVQPPPRDLFVDAALRYFNFASKRLRVEKIRVAGQTDVTTGNFAVQLFEVAQGMQGHLTLCTVDIPGSASVNPSAPAANAAIFAFLAIGPPSTGMGNPPAALIAQLRRGMVAFLPTAAGGPTVPGQWTFNDSNAPTAMGGEAFWYVLNGGSQASVANTAIVVNGRVNLENRE